MKNTTQAFLLLIAVVFIWGITWPIMKVGLAYTPPIWFSFLRMSIGAIGVFFLLLIYRKLSFPPRSDYSVIFSIAILQMAAPTALMHFALVYVDAGRASLLAYTHPLWVAPVAVLLLKESITPSIAWGLFLGLLGLMVLFNPFSFDWSNSSALIGNGMLILSAICWAAGILHVRSHRWTSTPLELAPWEMLIAGIILGVLALIREDMTDIVPALPFFATISFTGLIATAFCYWGAVVVSKRLPAMVSSIGFLGVPVIGLLSSIVILSERLTFSLALGLVCIVTGICILIIGERGAVLDQKTDRLIGPIGQKTRFD
ncbi:MAG: DMT family transporter [Desulfobacteraceae bacterium]|nr:DMT family transporter [Desulfobacteraceae bacterium]